MLLVVPNGKVKLLNALPFAPADLRRDSLEQAWRAYREAWRSPRVRELHRALRQGPGAAAARERNLGAGFRVLRLSRRQRLPNAERSCQPPRPPRERHMP